MKLQAVARVLAYLKRGLGGWKAREAKAKAAYQETPEYQLYAEIVRVRTYVQGLGKAVETSLRALILEAFGKTGEKKPAPGMGVRVSKGKERLEYIKDREHETWAWLHENAPAAMMPNDAVVLAMLKAGTEIPGVKLVMDGEGNATATISAKLDELYLEED